MSNPAIVNETPVLELPTNALEFFEHKTGLSGEQLRNHLLRIQGCWRKTLIPRSEAVRGVFCI